MGLTRGDKLFFDGADSFYEIARQFVTNLQNQNQIMISSIM